MKVLNFKFVTTALFLVLTLFAAGCAAQTGQTAQETGKDAAQSETQSAAFSEIAGTWQLDAAENGDTGEALPMDDIDLQVLVLTADGTADVTDDDGETERMTFRAENGVFTLVEKDGDEDVYQYTLDDGMLVLTEEDDDDPLLIMTFRSTRD